MKMLNDSHLEVKKFLKGTFFIRPYETGWVGETILFVIVEKTEGDPILEGRVRLSQDDIHWADDGSEPVIFEGLSQHIIKVDSSFGNHIRLAISIKGGEMFLNPRIACKG